MFLRMPALASEKKIDYALSNFSELNQRINENIRNYLKQENHAQSLEQAVKNILTQHKNLILSTIGLVVTVFYLTQKNVAS